MNFIENIKLKVRDSKKRIVLIEPEDIRIITAASIVEKEKIASIILIGDKEKISSFANDNNVDISNIEIINPINFSDFDILKNRLYELRKEKGMTLEEANNLLLNNKLYFGNMLVERGYADGLVAGAVTSSKDVLSSALKIIKTATDKKIVSSLFIMDVPNCSYGDNGLFIYSDCGLIQNPTSEELVEIAKNSSEAFENIVGGKARIALLSHSTLASSTHADVLKVSNAVKLAKSTYPELALDGEFQFDTAVVPEVAKIKAPNSLIAGYANVLIFPDLDSGNIAYKITERLAHAKAYGPITYGLSKPVNDLSRGSSIEDIVGVIVITAFQAINMEK